MTRRTRLDAELVRRGLARSREQAVALVEAGRVRVGGNPAAKPATQVDPAAPIVVSDRTGAKDYVSRAGHKLAGALDAFAGDGTDGREGLAVRGRRCLDAGASTGGFTDVLLRRGAGHVVCVDVGYGQLAWSLRSDPRVTVHDRTNVRDLDPAIVGQPADLVVADLSFISLRLVLAALVRCATQDADFLPMVKPQFEVGRDGVGPGGVVRERSLRAEAVAGVARAAHDEHGLGVLGVIASSLPGPAGNVEYFLWLRRDAPALTEAELAAAVSAGPS